MDFSWRFDLWYSRLPASPKDAGTVHALVTRPGDPSSGERATPEVVQVSPEDGIAGDRWKRDADRRIGSQVSLINVHVARSLAGGDAVRAALCGDNVHVDLDLSEENLPVGTRLALGSALLEVSSEVHRPCRKFAERLGATAAKKVARANRVGRRGRGVMCQVVTSGEIRVGDTVRVQRGGAASGGRHVADGMHP